MIDWSYAGDFFFFEDGYLMGSDGSIYLSDEWFAPTGPLNIILGDENGMTAVDEAFIEGLFEEALENLIIQYTDIAHTPRKAMEARMMDLIRTMYRDGNILNGTQAELAAYEGYVGAD